MTGSRLRVAIRAGGMVFAAAIVLLWPAHINGGPFWFPDTGTYIRGADAATVVLTGSPSEWSDRITILESEPSVDSRSATSARGVDGTGATSLKVVPERPVLLNRSIYYGFFLYVPMRGFGPWGGIAAQALAVAACLLFVLSIVTRKLARHRDAAIIGIIAGLAVLTPLPYYTSMLMPDVWSGVIIALLATAICFGHRISRVELALLLAISAVIATFHMTQILLAVAVGIAGIIMLTGLRAKLNAIMLTLGVAGFGYLSSLVFAMAVESQLDAEPLSPPFLTASLIDSGLGLSYLNENCGSDGARRPLALCDDRAKFPMESDDFLWSEEPTNGLFQLASPERQRRIANEDKRFYLSVVAHDPVHYGRSVMTATWQSLVDFDLKNFNYSNLRQSSIEATYPPGIASQVMKSRAFHGTMPTEFSVVATILTVAASIAIIGWLAFVKYGLLHRNSRYPLILVLAVLANAAICGALSKPDARYSMRLYWLLPFAACALLIRHESENRRFKPE